MQNADTPINVTAGENVTIAVQFLPTVIGTHSGSLILTHNAKGSPDTVQLTGYGHSEDGFWKLVPGSPTNVSRMAYDANNGNLWVGTSDGFVYLYNGTIWQQRGRVSQIYISSIAVSPNVYIYVGNERNGLYRSTNEGSSWNNVFYTSNVIEPIVISSSGEVYFSTMGSGVYRPNGNSWTNVSSGLRDQHVYSLTYYYYKSFDSISRLRDQHVYSLTIAPNGTLYAGMFFSPTIIIYRSTDGGVSWLLSSSFTTTGAITNFAVVDNNYYIGNF